MISLRLNDDILSMMALMSQHSVAQVLVISSKDSLKLKVVTVNRLDERKIKEYFEEKRIAFVDSQKKLHVHADKKEELLSNVKQLKCEAQTAIEDVQGMEDDEFDEFQFVIVQVSNIFNASQKAEAEKSSKAKTSASVDHRHVPVVDVETLDLQVQLRNSQFITQILESFAQAESKEKARREEDYKARLEKEVFLKLTILNWALKKWNLKVEDIASQVLKAGVDTSIVKRQARDWHPLHPNHSGSSAAPAA